MDDAVRRPSKVMRWLVIAVVVLAALLLGVGGLTIAAPLSSQPAAYLADRNLGLAILLLVLLAIKWARALGAVLLTTAIIHVVDAIADVHFQSPAAIAGSDSKAPRASRALGLVAPEGP